MHLAPWQILVLSIVQGAAELLPVSSSAHVIFMAKLLGLDPKSPQFVFLLVMLHTGTMGAVLLFFWQRWRALVRHEELGGLGGFAKRVVVATGVTGVLGLALKELIERVFLGPLTAGGHEKAEIEQLFDKPPLIAAALAAVGVIILAARLRDRPDNKSPLSVGSAALIGAVQGLCLPFRGFSRSGATISTGLFLGIPRGVCEDFSFALAVVLTPPVIARSAWKLVKATRESAAAGQAIDLWPIVAPGLIGMVLAFGSGYLALKLLSDTLEKGRWRFFGFYCLAFAALFAACHFLGVFGPPAPPA